jgi:hypothetical protein
MYGGFYNIQEQWILYKVTSKSNVIYLKFLAVVQTQGLRNGYQEFIRIFLK